ncbi:MAG: IS3 family transposase [Roseburia sp.]
MYYGYEKNYSSFEEFSQAVAEYIDYYNNKRIQAKQNGCRLYNTG